MKYTEMERALVDRGPFAYGSDEDLPRLAGEWEEEGFSPREAGEWLDAGCFVAASAAELRDADVTPREAAAPWRDGVSLGYAFANGDVGLAAFEMAE